jgi:tetratricopeptide (TPR) repeat protein
MAEQPATEQEQLSSPPRNLLRAAAGIPRAATAWVKGHKLPAAIAGGACLLLAVGFAATSIISATRKPAEKPITMEEVFGALDAGEYIRAQQLAELWQTQIGLSPDEAAAPTFALGAAIAYQADDAWRKHKQKAGQYLAAARYLQQADRYGFPAGREAEGLFLLGKCLYLSGQIPASRPILLDALQVNRTKQSDIHWLLAEAYLNDAHPKLEQALAENSQFLSDSLLPPKPLEQGLLQRARILLRLDKKAECAAAIERIPKDSEYEADALVIGAQLLMEEARLLCGDAQASPEDMSLAREKYRAAIQTLKLAQSRDTLLAQATKKAMYLAGLCLLAINDQLTALDQFQQTRMLYPDYPEGVAAVFQEAEIQRILGRDADALASYRRALAAIGTPENYSNPWIELEQLRAGIIAAVEYYKNAGNYELCSQLARLTHPLLPREKMFELAADVYKTWGHALLSEAEQSPPGKAEQLRRHGRAELRLAGHYYWNLSKLQAATRQYPDILWNSAMAYFEGQDYRNAVPMLQKYLQNESRLRRPEAMVALGEAFLSTDQFDKALETFQECIKEYGRDAAAHRARLTAAKASLEKNDAKLAESLLIDNLMSDYVTPESQEWRDSLFALGRLLHNRGRYQEAIIRLEEAVQRYPDAQFAVAARYVLADSYRRLAGSAQESQNQDASKTDSATQRDRSRRLYENALGQYKEVQKSLALRHKTRELTAEEKLMARNADFAVANVLFSLDQFEAAIKAYSKAAKKYENRPESLEAYVQMAAVYRQMDDPDEARGALEQAKAAVEKIKNDSLFTETTNFDRIQWNTRLNELMKL